jgi:hypothetical protein
VAVSGARDAAWHRATTTGASHAGRTTNDRLAHYDASAGSGVTPPATINGTAQARIKDDVWWSVS